VLQNLLAGDWSLRNQSIGRLEEKSDRRKLIVDVDGPRQNGRLKLGPIFATLHICGIVARWIRYDRTRRGWHIIIMLGIRLEWGETVALQLLCGDDRRRGNLNLMRAIAMRVYGASKFWKARWNIAYAEKLETGQAIRH
jgi:hypothetical protein